MAEAQIVDIHNTNNVDATTREHWHNSIPVENNSASVAIVKGDLLALVWTESGEHLKAALADTATHDPALPVAVADEAIVASGAGMATIKGFARVNIGAGAVAAGERMIMTAATPGVADGVAADATTVDGDTHGVFLGDEIGTSNKAPVWLD